MTFSFKRLNGEGIYLFHSCVSLLRISTVVNIFFSMIMAPMSVQKTSYLTVSRVNAPEFLFAFCGCVEVSSVFKLFFRALKMRHPICV